MFGWGRTKPLEEKIDDLTKSIGKVQNTLDLLCDHLTTPLELNGSVELPEIDREQAEKPGVPGAVAMIGRWLANIKEGKGYTSNDQLIEDLERAYEKAGAESRPPQHSAMSVLLRGDIWTWGSKKQRWYPVLRSNRLTELLGVLHKAYPRYRP